MPCIGFFTKLRNRAKSRIRKIARLRNCETPYKGVRFRSGFASHFVFIAFFTGYLITYGA